MPEKTIGIIGFGRFGKLLTKYLSNDFDVYVSSSSADENDINKLNAKKASLEEVCKKDIVIPCVPISAFEDTINKIKNHLKENSLVIDVCSVKEYPVKIMKEILPEKIQILATHPLFGPDSISDTSRERKIVLCKVRISDEHYKKIKSYLKNEGFVVIEATPEEHDKEVAKSLVLTHFIGRALIDFEAKELSEQGPRKRVRKQR